MNYSNHHKQKEDLMNQARAFCSTIIALLVLGLAVATGASAAQWLYNNSAAFERKTTVEGSWLLLGLSIFGANKTHVVCSNKLNGLIGPGAADVLEKVEGLNPGEATTIKCVVLKTEQGNCTGSETAFVTFRHLSWNTTLTEPKPSEFIDRFKAGASNENPAVLLECRLQGGSLVSVLCEESEIITDPLENLANGVRQQILNQLAKCTGEIGAAIHIYAQGLITSPEGGKVSVSK